MKTETEIEARFGIYSTNGFQSGLKKNEFEFLLNILSTKKENKMTVVKELDYIYESPFPELPVRYTPQWSDLSINWKSKFTLWNVPFTIGKGKLRVTLNEESNKLERATIKNRSRNHLLTFSGMPYDCRVSISTEVEVPLPPQGLPPTFEMKRHKVQSTIHFISRKKKIEAKEEKRREVVQCLIRICIFSFDGLLKEMTVILRGKLIWLRSS